ncbi:hypothetical protein AX14_004506 [Amanita brunnescens Koide BX004]|nr:hypothetical protein AX14_004506 [Amanita brunnescens Koide BX004]
MCIAQGLDLSISPRQVQYITSSLRNGLSFIGRTLRWAFSRIGKVELLIGNLVDHRCCSSPATAPEDLSSVGPSPPIIDGKPDEGTCSWVVGSNASGVRVIEGSDEFAQKYAEYDHVDHTSTAVLTQIEEMALILSQQRAEYDSSLRHLSLPLSLLK